MAAETQAEIRSAKREFQAHRELMARTIDALNQLVIVHSELEKALSEDRNLNARSLLIAAREIDMTINKIEKIREKRDDD